MRELLSGALPPPQDEPPQRDVVDAAMDWGARRRRRDWTLTGAAALAVVAVATGAAAVSGGGGSGGGSTPAAGQSPTGVSTHRSMAGPGSQWTPYCDHPATLKGNLAEYCSLFNQQQSFSTFFAIGAAKYIQAALPAGFTVQTTSTWVLILTGPNGKTNYLFASTEPASTLQGPLRCATTPPTSCVEITTAGGTVVVDTGPSGAPSAGYVGQGRLDPRIDLILGTSATGGMNGIAPPTSPVPLLDTAQLVRILSDQAFLDYTKGELHHLEDIEHQMQTVAPPSMSDVPPSGATDMRSSSAPGDATSPPYSSPSGPPTGGTSGWSRPPSSTASSYVYFSATSVNTGS